MDGMYGSRNEQMYGALQDKGINYSAGNSSLDTSSVMECGGGCPVCTSRCKVRRF